MGYYSIKRPDGTYDDFIIAGEEPTPSEQTRINDYLSGKTPAKAPPPPEPRGFWGSGIAGIASGYHSGMSGVYRGLQGYTDTYGGEKNILGHTPEEWGEFAAEETRKAQEDAPEKGFLDTEGFWNKMNVLAYTAGQTALPALGGAAAAATGIGFIPAALVGGALYTPQMFAENVDQQIQQHGYVKDWDKAVGATGANALIEGVLGRLTLGIAGVANLKGVATKLTPALIKEAVEKGTSTAAGMVAKRVGAAATVGTIGGASEEVLQSIVTRLQADMPINDENSAKEYIEAAVVGGLLEGAFGAGAGVVGGVADAKDFQKYRQATEDYKKKAKDVGGAITASERERKDEINQRVVEEEANLVQGRIAQTPRAIANRELKPFTMKEETKGSKTEPPFSEEEYRQVADLLKVTGKKFSPEKIRKIAQLGSTPQAKRKAQSIFDTLFERGEAKRVGNENQFGKMLHHDVVREYNVAPIPESQSKRFGVRRQNGNMMKDRFDTIEKAQERATELGEGFEAVEDTKKQYGVYETLRRTAGVDRGKVVETHPVHVVNDIEQANLLAKSYDPSYSPETNRLITKKEQVAIRDRVIGELNQKPPDPKLVKAMEQFKQLLLGNHQVSTALRSIIPGATPDTKVEGVTRAFDTEAGVKQIIEISNAVARGDLNKIKSVFTHEAVHAMRNMGLFTQPEWDSLIKAAHQRIPGKRYSWFEQAALSAERDAEQNIHDEAIAEMFRAFHDNPTQFTKPYRNFLQRMLDFIKHLAGINKNIPEAHKIMQDMLSGQIARRPAGFGGEVTSERVFWSSIRVPGFYWKSDKYLDEFKTDPNWSAKKWIARIQNQSQIPKTEQEWIGFKPYLEQFGDRVVPLEDLRKYVRAHSVEIAEVIDSSADSTPRQDELRRILTERYNDYLKQVGAPKDEAGLDKWIDENVFIGEPLSTEYVRLKKSNKAANQRLPFPEWGELTQPGGDAYTTIVITMPMAEGDFPGHFSSIEEPQLMQIRFTTRYYDNDSTRPVLFIEELQSDVIQQGRRYGYSDDPQFSKEALFEQMMIEQEGHQNLMQAQIQNALPLVKGFVKASGDEKLIKVLDNVEHFFGRINGANTVLDDLENAHQYLESRIFPEGRVGVEEPSDQTKAETRLFALIEKQLELELAADELEEMRSGEFGPEDMDTREIFMGFPRTPLNSSWPQFGFKRLVRYAADNGFAAIAWHGEPDSVAATQKWRGLTSFVDERGNTKYEERDNGAVTGVVRMYLEELPNWAKKQFNENEFPGANVRLVKHESRSKPVSTFDEVLGDTSGFSPDNRTPEAFRLGTANYYLNTDIIADGPNLDVGGVVARAIKADKEILKVLTALEQNKNLTADEALKDSDLTPQQLQDLLRLTRYYDWMAGFNDPLVPGMHRDDNGNPLYDRYEMNITPDIIKAAQRHGFQAESKVLYSAYRDVPPGEEGNLAPNGRPPQWAATAPLGARVNAGVPASDFDEIIAKKRHDNISPVLKRITGLVPSETFREKADKTIDAGIFNLQDRMLHIGRLIDNVRKNGGRVDATTDTFLRERLFVGKADTAIVNADKEYYEPTIEAVHSIGATSEQLNELAAIDETVKTLVDFYAKPNENGERRTHRNLAMAELAMLAQHARERNAEMRRRNERVQFERPNQYQHGSGMSDEVASSVLAYIAARPGLYRKVLDLTNPDSVRSRVRKLIAYTNRVRVEGQLTPDFSNLTTYQDYVPLRDFAQEHPEGDDDANYLAKTGKGYTIRGKEDRSATGRESLPANVISHAVLQNTEALIRAHKADVGRSFLKFLQDHGEIIGDAARVIHSAPVQWGLDPRTGSVRRMTDLAFRNRDDILTVKKADENGRIKEYYIEFKDPRLARALTVKSSLGNTDLSWFLKQTLRMNHLLGRLSTSWNPEFLLSNIPRDFGTAMMNLTEYEIDGLRRAVVANVNQSRKDVWHWARTGEESQILADFRADGGMTAFMGTADINDTMKKVMRKVDDDPTVLPKYAKETVKSIGKYIEDMNLVAENMIRLAAYKALRDKFIERGASETEAREWAALGSKELTVNFNAGGDMKPAMNALYLFYNASLQGSVALMNPLIRSPKMRKMYAGVVLGGIMQDLLMSWLMGDDYDEIPEWILEHNMLFPNFTGIGDRNYIKIPLPYLLHAVWNSGRATSRMLRGASAPGEAASTIVSSFAEGLNPWGWGGNGWLNFVAPTFMDPMIDLGAGKDFTGNYIAPPPSPFGQEKKDSQRYWNNTSPIAISIADWLSRISGSDGKYLPGKLEISPNNLEYIYEFGTGGAGAFALRVFDFLAPGSIGGQGILEHMVTGLEEVSANDIPMLRRYVGNFSERSDLGTYIKRRDQVMSVRQELNDAIRTGNSAHYLDIMRKYPDEYRMAAQVNKIESLRRKLSKQINSIKDSKALTDEQKEDRIRVIRNQQNDLVEMGLRTMEGL